MSEIDDWLDNLAPEFNDPIAYDQLDTEIRIALDNWIATTPIKVLCNTSTSYGLKHKFQDATGIYVTNGQFKGAMLANGYEPYNRALKNWRFKRPRRR